MISKLRVVQDCLENEFREFLNPRHYEKAETTTVNVIDAVVAKILTESPSVNRHYENASRGTAGEDLTGTSTYHLQLALTHHDMSSPEDFDALSRRSRRLLEVLKQPRKKVFFYIHPIMGVADYHRQKRELLEEFSWFSRFVARRSVNVSGLFFIVVKSHEATPPQPSVLVLKDDHCSVYELHVNRDFVDANAPFAGDCERELETMIDIVRKEEFSQAATYKVYFPLFDDEESASNEVRLVHEGLVAHPQVTLVDAPEGADLVVFCQNHLVDSHPFHVRFRAIKDRYKHKTIMLDYGDDAWSLLDEDDFRWRLYYKRSCVDRANGSPLTYGGLPIRTAAYCVLDAMCEPPASAGPVRSIDIACLFEDGVLDSPHFALARGRLLKMVKRLARSHPELSVQIGTVSECGPVGRSRVAPEYKHCLYDSKIVLHANPDHWEGDSRLWEALASGALVFVDRMHAPMKQPLVDGEHLIFYDLTDAGMALLAEQVLSYLADETERERIAMQGRAFVLEHHRSLDRVNEIIAAFECTTPITLPSAATAGPAAALNIIVSIATGYTDISQYRQFVSTLRRTGATCPLFLGISEGAAYEPVKKYLLENGVNTFIVPPITPPNKVVNGYRFAQYRLWLRGLDFRYALMMDFRDAYFQSDPFADVESAMEGCDLYLMSEFQLLTVGNHPNGMNYGWVAEPFGTATADAIADRVILNSGAILGRKEAVKKFLDLISEVTTAQDFDHADQGTLNYLAHTGRLDGCGRIKTVPAGKSIVNNCGFTELDLLRETRAITAEEEARIAFIPRTAGGRLKLYRDHEGWVLDDDGNVSAAVHQYDRFLPEIDDLVSRLSEYEPPDRVFVSAGGRPYRGEKYSLSSRAGLRPDSVERLIQKVRSLPAHRKPLLTLPGFKRGFVFSYGTLNVDLLFEPTAARLNLFSPQGDGRRRAEFLDRWGYQVFFVEEDDLFVTSAPARSATLTAHSFSEARADAERWVSQPLGESTAARTATDRIQHIVSAWKGHEGFAVKLVEYLRPSVVVELGVDYGFSAFAFALPNIGTVYGIDWFQGDKYAGIRTTHDLVLHERENLGLTNLVIINAEFAETARSWNRQIDVLHIDGDHDYASVKQDFESWARFVKDDGVILMHDTISFPDDVGRFFEEIELPKFNFLHSHGLGVVCKNRDLLNRVARL